MNTKTAELLLVAVTMIAAAGWLFSKMALATFPPFTFLAMRFCFAALVLACVCRIALFTLTRSELKRTLLTGCILGWALMFFIMGLELTESIGEGAFILSLTVVMVPIVSKLLYSDTIPRQLIIALCPAIAGLACLTLENGFRFETAQLCFLAANVGFAFHMTLSSHIMADVPALPSSTIQLLITGLMALCAAIIVESWPTNISTVAWLWVFASAVFATSFRFSLQIRAFQFLKPSHASMIFILEPVWTALLGAGFLSERLSAFQGLGCLLIFTSLLVFRWRTVVQFVKQL